MLTWSIVHRLSALVFLLVVNLLTAQQSGLRITIVEGDGDINNINQKVNVLPVVEVRDESGKLLEGAAVVFSLPTQGPGGFFSNGTNTLTATTDRQGRATASGIRLNRQTGKFDIRVTASLGGQTASATITQTNVSGVSTSAHRRILEENLDSCGRHRRSRRDWSSGRHPSRLQQFLVGPAAYRDHSRNSLRGRSELKCEPP